MVLRYTSEKMEDLSFVPRDDLIKMLIEANREAEIADRDAQASNLDAKQYEKNNGILTAKLQYAENNTAYREQLLNGCKEKLEDANCQRDTLAKKCKELEARGSQILPDL